MKLESVKSKSQAYVRQVSLAGLGVLGAAQKEGRNLFNSLVEEGEKAQARRRREAAQAPASASLQALRDKALDGVEKLQQVVQENAANALHWLGLASKVDIQVLAGRLDELKANVQKLADVRKAPANALKVAVDNAQVA